MKKITVLSLLIVSYFLIVILWIFIFVTGQKNSFINYIFVFAYGLIPLLGGIGGIRIAKNWGFLKSAMGKALFFLSLGLITWSGGETIWSYYNLILQVEIPYPSLADVSFIISWPLWIIGVYYISKATGAKYGIKQKHGPIQIMLIPLTAIIVSYYLLIIVARQGTFKLEGDIIKVFFDLAYPILDVVILTFALLIYGLSFQYLGGRYKLPVIIILLGFVINYFADFGFSYTTTVGTYFNASWPDLLFATAMFILSYGVNSFTIKDR